MTSAQFAAVQSILEGIPFIPPDRRRELYNFIREVRPLSILELGFAHGVSTCCMAAALRENGGGKITTIDLESARERSPNLAQLLDRTNLAEFVHPVYSATSYTWELMRFLQEAKPGDSWFDFVFIDGAHDWNTDGFAFYLVDHLLAPNSWILFDDLDWTFATSPTLKDTEMVRNMTPEERETTQVGKVFDLLVRRHPGYGEFRVDGAWGWAHKLPRQHVG